MWVQVPPPAPIKTRLNFILAFIYGDFMNSGLSWSAVRAMKNTMRPLVVSVFEFLEDVPGEMLFDLTMARHRLTATSPWILIPVVMTTAPDGTQNPNQTAQAAMASHGFPLP